MLGTRRWLLPSSAADSGAGGSTTAYGAVSVRTRPLASATRRFVDDGIEGVRDALDERKARVGPDIDEAEVALFSAQRRSLVAVALEHSNGAARVLDGVCLEQFE
jgi:hypothetical protein